MKTIDLTGIIDAVENTLDVDFCNEHRRGIELIAAEYLKQKTEVWAEERAHTPYGIVEEEVSLIGKAVYFIQDSVICKGVVCGVNAAIKRDYNNEGRIIDWVKLSYSISTKQSHPYHVDLVFPRDRIYLTKDDIIKDL